MADVKICDRCGKTIATTTAQSFGLGAWRYSLWRRGASSMTSYDYDLCTDCGDKLTKFLNVWEPDEKPDDALVYAR